MNEQSRINAMISYFFLGPLFLLAKKGTPLAEPYVCGHAKKSSLIILISLIIFLIYSFLLKDLLDFSILTLHIRTIVLATMSSFTLFFLMIGAYNAYHGIQSDVSTFSLHSTIEVADLGRDITEEEKIRLIATMIPFLGIYLARDARGSLQIRARVIGSFLGGLIIMGSILSSAGSLILSLLFIIAILIFVVIAVQISLEGRFPSYPLLSSLPTYEVAEAHIFASIRSVGEFFRIAFGGQDKKGYHVFLSVELEKRGGSHAPETPYFMPAGLIGLPVWNIFTLPSLWIEKYREYREYVISGLVITLSMGLIVVFSSSASPYLLLFLFPIVHMMTYASTDLAAYIPGIHIIMRIIGMARATREKIGTESIKKEEVSFNYEVK